MLWRSTSELSSWVSLDESFQKDGNWHFHPHIKFPQSSYEIGGLLTDITTTHQSPGILLAGSKDIGQTWVVDY